MAEYNSSFTGKEIDERLGKVPELEVTVGQLSAEKVSVTPQELSEAQKAQARANIGIVKNGISNLFDINNILVTGSGVMNANLPPIVEGDVLRLSGKAGDFAGGIVTVPVYENREITFSAYLYGETGIVEFVWFKSFTDQRVIVDGVTAKRVAVSAEGVVTYSFTIPEGYNYFGFCGYSATQYGMCLKDIEIVNGDAVSGIIDDTLSIGGYIAEAAAVGRALSSLATREMLDELSAEKMNVFVDGATTNIVAGRYTEPVPQQYEYLGLNTASVVSGKLVLTPATDNNASARLYYKIPVKYGDVIHVETTDYWTAETFYYEPVVCSDEETFVSATGFMKTDGGFVNISISAINAAYVYLGIALKNSAGSYIAPGSWGVVDGEYGKAFVFDDPGADGNHPYKGKYVVVQADGRIGVEENGVDIQTPWVNIAHRGLTKNVRENTIPAFYEALLDECTGFECDVRITSDGVAVLCHDATISGTVNGASTTMTIADSTFANISALVLTSGEPYGDIHIPKLEDVLRFARHYDMQVNIDIKDTSTACVNEIVSLVKKCGISKRVQYFTATNPTVILKNILDMDALAKVVFYYSDDMSSIEGVTTDPEKIVIAIQPYQLTESAISAIRTKQYGMYCWGVTSSTYETAFSAMPDYVEYTTGTVVAGIVKSYLESISFW